MVGIQETKWFGADVWPAVIMLCSGRLAPASGDELEEKVWALYWIKEFCCMGEVWSRNCSDIN